MHDSALKQVGNPIDLTATVTCALELAVEWLTAAVSVARCKVLYGGSVVASPFEAVVASAAAVGFDAITLWPAMCLRAARRSGLDLAGMQAVLDDHGLRVAALEACDDWYPGDGGAASSSPLRSPWSADDLFDAAVVLGAPMVTAAHLSTATFEHGAAVDGFAMLCSRAAERGILVGLEPISFTRISDPLIAQSILIDADQANSGLVLDTAHLVRSGVPIGECITRLNPQLIVALQLADGSSAAPEDLIEEAMFGRLLPGEGELGVASIIAAVAARGVSCDVGPEVYRNEWRAAGVELTMSLLMESTMRVLRRAGV